MIRLARKGRELLPKKREYECNKILGGGGDYAVAGQRLTRRLYEVAAVTKRGNVFGSGDP